MCYNCGCANPQDDMGSPDNITRTTLQHLSQNLNKSPDETKLLVFEYLEKNDPTNPQLEEMFTKASRAWGQSVEEAKKETYNQLKAELKK